MDGLNTLDLILAVAVGIGLGLLVAILANRPAPDTPAESEG